MLTLNYFVRKKPDVAAEEFRDYWLDSHFDARRDVLKALGVKKYVKCETLLDDPINELLRTAYGTPPDIYDFVDQLVIGDIEDLKTGLASEEVAREIGRLSPEEAQYVDHSRSDLWMNVDLPQIYPREDIQATWNNTYLKAFMVASAHPELSLSEGQLHWNACHGALARQFAEFLPYDKYLQAHRLESAVLKRLKNAIGVQFEERPRVLGHAEVWLDRRTAATMNGPEVERMMSMLVEDISLFVRLNEAHLFAGKEHIQHSEPVIDAPLPKMFGAD